MVLAASAVHRGQHCAQPHIALFKIADSLHDLLIGDVLAHILKLLCQIISNGAAAYDHGIFYLIGLQTYLAENSAAFLGVAMMEMTSPSCKIKLPSGI